MRLAGILRAAAVSLCLLVGAASRAAGQQRLDLLGDPLPQGAIARMGSGRLRHTGGVYSVSFHPDGKRLASSGKDGFVRFWDAATGQLLRRQQFDGSFLRQVAFSPDGRRYLVIDGNGAMILCDTDTGRRRQMLGGPSHRCTNARFAPDGKSLAVAADGVVELWQIEDSGLVKRWSRTSASENLSAQFGFAPDGSWIAAADANVVRRLRADTGEVVQEMVSHGGPIRGIDVSPDGRRIALAVEDETIRVWSAETGSELWRQENAHGLIELSYVVFSPDGKTLLSGGYDGALRFWDAAGGEQLRHFDDGRNHNACWAPDGNLFATWNAGEFSIRIRDAQTGEDRPDLPGHGYPPKQLLFLDGGRLLASGASNDGSLRVWDVETGRQVRAWNENAAAAIAPVSGTRFIVATGYDNRFARFDVDSGAKRELASADPRQVNRYWWPAVSADGKRMVTVVRTTRRVERDGGDTYEHESELVTWRMPECKRLDSITPGGDVSQVEILPDGSHFFALAREGPSTRLKVWSFDDLRKVRTVFEADAKHPIEDIAVSPTAPQAALALGNQGVVLLELPQGKLLHKWTAKGFLARQVSFSGDGCRLAGDGMGCRVWDVETGRTLHAAPGDCGALSHDGRLLANCYKGTISLWDVDAGKLLVEWRGPMAVQKLLFTPDGKRLLSSGNDGTFLTWSLDPADWPRGPQPEKPVAMDELWRRLGEREAEAAYQAARQMIERPAEALALLASQLPGEVDLPASPVFDDPALLRLYRAEYVLKQIEGEAAKALRGRFRRAPPPRLGPYVARDHFDPLGDPLPKGAVLRMGTERYYVGTSDFHVAFSPDGGRAAVFSQDRGDRRVEGLIQVFETRTGKLQKTLRVPRLDFVEMAYAPGGDRIVCVARDRIVVVDIEAGSVVREWAIGRARPDYVASAHVAPDGDTVVVGDSAGAVEVWDIATGRKLAETSLQRSVGQVRHLDKGKRVAVPAFDKTRQREAGIWDYAAGKWEFRKALTKDEIGLAFSPDGKTYAVACKNGGIQLKTTSDSTTAKTIQAGNPSSELFCATLSFSPDGRWIVASFDRMYFFIFDCRTGAAVFQNIGFSRGMSTAISRDGKYLAWSGQKVHLQIQDLEEARDLTAEALDKSLAGGLLVSADGRTTIRGRDSQRWLCDPLSLQPAAPLPVIGRLLAVSRDGRFCVTGTDYPRAYTVWEVATQTALRRIRHSGIPVSHAVFTADGRRVALIVAHGRNAQFTYDLLTGDSDTRENDAMRTITARSLGITSPLGVYATVTKEGAVEISESATSKLVRQFDAGVGAQIEFLPDGRRLVVRAANGVTTVWDLAFLAATRGEDESVRRRLERLWPDLSSADGRRGMGAVFAYVAAGDEAVDCLRAQLYARPPDAAEVRRLVRRLDDNEFKVREQATRRLIALGAGVEAVLNEALRNDPSVELRARIERIQSTFARDTASLQRSRARLILEQIATPAAEELKRELAEILSPAQREGAALAPSPAGRNGK